MNEYEYVLVKLVYHNNITTDNNGQSNCSLIPPMKQYKVTINYLRCQCCDCSNVTADKDQSFSRQLWWWWWCARTLGLCIYTPPLVCITCVLCWYVLLHWRVHDSDTDLVLCIVYTTSQNNSRITLMFNEFRRKSI